MKTAIYVRVSTENQSTESQEREISMYLTSNQIKMACAYKDYAESGKKESRPALNSLLNEVKQGKVDTLVVFKLDRAFRSLSHLLDCLKLFQKHNVKFVSIKENIDLSTPVGILMVQMLGAFAQFERSMIVERVKSGLRNAKAKGVQLGHPTKVPLSVQQQVVTLKSSGHSYTQVAAITGLKIPAIQRILARSLTDQVVTRENK